MGLTCGCDFDYEPGMKVAYTPDNYEEFNGKRRQRCISCNELISIGDTAARVKRFRVPEHDVEINIYGDDGEIPIADKWMCERCADICFSLDDLGYCVNPHDNMMELLDEYADTYGA